MSLNISRAVLRQSTKFTGRTVRRFESTTTQKATEAAKDTASKASQTTTEYKSKATEGLSRVSSAAGPAISTAAKGLGSALGKVGGRTGKLIAFVQRQIPPTVYYARVGLEISKLVFKGRNMLPPNPVTIRGYYERVASGVSYPQQFFERNIKPILSIRSLDATKLVAGGVAAAEVLGFFTVGEMIGRFKLVGYRGETGH